ncbi:MAG: hypothetical protein ABIO70_12760 [Pseudomonadota bacterium]
MAERIRIFVGAYGSGKTEIALNQAFGWAGEGRRVGIADLDLVNPFFRSRELRGALEAAGVRVLAPAGELSEADLPIIVPEVQGGLDDAALDLVLDVGGDDAGSRALARFARSIERWPHQVYMVLNDRRPWTGDTEGIAQTIRRVQDSARLSVTAIISNPNLGADTTPAIVAQGHATVVRAAEALGLPVAFLTVLEELAPAISHEARLGVPLLPIRRHLFPPWYEDPTRFAPPRDMRSRAMRNEIQARKAGSSGPTGSTD